MSGLVEIIKTAKKYWYRYVVISLLLAIVAGVWIEWREEQDAAVHRVESEYSQLALSQTVWLNLSSKLVAQLSNLDATYPNREELKPLELGVRGTLDSITVFYTPTNNIEKYAMEYRGALEDVLGAINQYRSDDKSTRRLLNTLQLASNVGGGLQKEINKYRTDAWRSFWSVII